MNASGNILKDSFYKERLLKSKHNSSYNLPQQSDPENQTAGPQNISVNLQLRQYLSKFQKTSTDNYAYIAFNCTHKLLKDLKIISQLKQLQEIDVSYNKLKSLKDLSGLKFLVKIKATNNCLKEVMDVKVPPMHLDTLDLSSNEITYIPNLASHVYLRILLLKNNKITAIDGLLKNKHLKILDLAQNAIQEIQGLDNLNLTELNLSNNQLEKIKGLNKLEHLRNLDLSINKIKKIGGLINLISLRQLNLAKNQIKNVREIEYLENLMHLTSVDLSYNPIQQRRYYRLQVIYKMPMLKTLDGSPLSGSQVVEAQSLFGLDVESKFTIFKNTLPEQEFIDRRIHTSELISNQTDSEGQHNNFVDQYDEEGKKTNSVGSRNKSMAGSKRSGFSKQSKQSKRSNFSKE